MRKLFGGLVLAAGVGGLGYWGAKDHAQDMQAAITSEAQTAVAGAIHAVETQVNGRDIRITGTADSDAERDALVAALNAVDGRRVVLDELEVLPQADPFTIAATRKSGATLLQGNVSSEAARAALAQTGAAGVEGLTLAGGAPTRWEAAVGAGLGTLSKLEDGAMSLNGTQMRLSGIVDTPDDRDALLASLALPEGYTLSSEIETRDDGRPIGYGIAFDAATGLTVNGKLPNGLDQAMIAEALGVKQVQGDAEAGIKGSAEPALAALGKLTSWLPEFETAKITMAGDSFTLEGTTTPGANAGLIAEAMKADIGEGMDIALAPTKSLPQDGAERVNASTGQREHFRFGAWLPKLDFQPSVKTCGVQAEAVMTRSKINFLSGSADLGPRAIRAINALAAVMGKCVLEAGLIAELGGHTDSTGSNNYELSAARAEAVRRAMIARGVPEEHLSAVGYGPSKPIADNSTEAGRAANRRTTVRWARP